MGEADRKAQSAVAADPQLLDELRSVAALASPPTTTGPATTSPARPTPTAAFVADMLAADPKQAPKHRDAIVQLLQAHPSFDLATGNIAQLLAKGPPTDPAHAASLRSSLRAMKRVFKLTPSYRQSKALLDAGNASRGGRCSRKQQQLCQPRLVKRRGHSQGLYKVRGAICTASRCPAPQTARTLAARSHSRDAVCQHREMSWSLSRD